MLDIDVSKKDLAQALKGTVDITRVDFGSDATGNRTVGVVSGVEMICTATEI